MGARVVVEEDPVLRAVPAFLDPSTSPEHERAVIDWYLADVPDFVSWREGFRARLAGLYPAEVVFASGQEDFREKLKGADAAIIESLEVGATELATAEQLRIVMKFGMLPTTVDLAACSARSVVVGVQRRRVNVAVAEHAMACILALAKRLPELDDVVTADRLTGAGFDITPFDRRYTGNSNFARIPNLATVAGSTIAIIGFGEIGREIAKRAAAFEMRVRYFQRSRLLPRDESALHATYGRLPEILAEADYVSVNLPVTSETRGIIDEAAFAAMKPGAILIDVARPELINRAALLAALDSGRLGGFALDVGYEEPMGTDDPLLDRRNVILTPHTAVGNRWNNLLDMEEMCGKLWRAVTGERSGGR
jgi:phosphoglycerate dehydrogenase-like enzyme